MKQAHAASVSRNSDPLYGASLPSRAGILPPTERRVLAGVETSRDYTRTDKGLFGREVRHYNLIAREISTPALTLDSYHSAELEGAILLACGEGSVDIREGLPSITRGREFRVARSADLFFGGPINSLSPGIYSVGDTIVDRRSGRVYLELEKAGITYVGVIGLFMAGRLPSCVDWRVIEPIRPEVK